MSESNGTWGAAASDELREAIDNLDPLPPPGEVEPLDLFLTSKNITHAGLLRVGVRWSPPFTLVYLGPGYVKYRDLSTGRRWTSIEHRDFSRLRVVHHDGRSDAEVCLIAEGETDAAWLSEHYTGCDVAILPSGSESFQESHVAQVAGYKQIIAMTDNDRAGIAGAARIQGLLPVTQVLHPTAKDWCEQNEIVELPPLEEQPRLFVSLRVLREMEIPEVLSYFDNAILPIGGQAMIHGWAKSYKSYLAFDLAACLAQGVEWCGFEFTGGEPAKVGIVQYEIKFPYYKQRMAQLYEAATYPGLLDDNYFTFKPLIYPDLKAGNQAQLEVLMREIEAAEIQVIVIDPIRQTLSGADMNSEQDASMLRNLVEPIKSMGVSVVLTHHDNKAAGRQGGGDPLGMTGSGAFAGDADTIISVSVPKEMTVKDCYRNLDFTLRNAPAPATRSMRFTEDERLAYLPTSADGGAVNDGANPDQPEI